MANPRIGIDATAHAALGKGVARYVRELLPELAALDAAVQPVALMPAGEALPAGAERLERVDVHARPAIRWEQVGLPRAARSKRLSLVHTTSDRLPLVTPVPLVLYLFEDPAFRLDAARGGRSGKKIAADLLTRALFASSLRRAALVLVASKATGKDVSERGVPSDRVRVVYPGVSSSFRPAREDEQASIRTRLDASGGYVLHFSSDDPRDNTGVVLRAYAELRRRRPDAPPLLIAGPVSNALAEQQGDVGELGIAGAVRWLGFVSAEPLLELYRGASVYIDPSRFEGFGFQVAEALASGVPVVCSNAASLPEVVADAAIVAAPDDVRAFAAGIEAVLSEGGPGPKLAASGIVRARRFSWARTASETVEAWLSVLGTRQK